MLNYEINLFHGRKHVIWDWNGTLLNDVDLCVGVISKILAEYRLPPVTKEQYRDHFCFPVRRYYEALGFDFSKHSWECVARQFIDLYHEGMYRAPLFEGTIALVQELRARSIHSSILSASHAPDLQSLLEHHQLTGLFESVCGLDHFNATSKIDVGTRLLDTLALDPSSLILIGDTDHDVEVARAMGIDVALFPDGHQNASTLERLGVPLLPKR